MSYEPEKVTKRTRGKMVMLYATVDGEEAHMASFFHEEKALFVLDAIKSYDGDIKIVDEDKKAAKKGLPKKRAIKKS